VSTPGQVESYDEETYKLKPGDSYRRISLSAYNTDRYERALMLWNRNHPQASDGARQDPPILLPGQDVFIPPARMLEKYYPGEVPEPTPAAAPLAPVPAPAPVAPVGLEVPRPAGGVPIAAAAPPAPVRPAPAAGEKAYRVRGNGEMFFNIAVRTLGSGDRWMEIYNLNRRYDPSKPVPAGAVLQLPKDARVEQGDMP
jgi:nucleoid-associated protein YgaU